MFVGIAGNRGSIATPSGDTFWGDKIETSKYGGNTTCFYIKGEDGSEHIVDAGTGIRAFGVHLTKKEGFNGQNNKRLNLYITHTHWDHIQGLPFFVPAYIKGNDIKVYGEAKIKKSIDEAVKEHSDQPGNYPAVMTIEGEGLHGVLKKQQEFRTFPAPLDLLSGITDYYDFISGGVIYETPTMKVETMTLKHPGNSIAYKFTEIDQKGKKKITVVATDHEPGTKSIDDKLTEFCFGADLLLGDVQFEPLDSKYKELNPFVKTWGHGDYHSVIQIATLAEVKKVAGVHFEPKMNDSYYDDYEVRAQTETKVIADKLHQKAVEFELTRESRAYQL